MKKIILLTIISIILFSFHIHAANRDSGFTMGLSGGGYTWDSREEINTGGVGMLRLGYDFSKHFGIEIPLELGGSTMKRTSQSENVTLMGYRLEGLLYFIPGILILD